MNILLTTEVIHPGGAETFVLRLSSALQYAGHNVQILIFYKKGFNKKLYNLLAPDVPLSFAEIPAPSFLRKVDSFFLKSSTDYSIRDRFIKQTIKKIIEQNDIEVIHSHLLKVDRLCIEVAREKNIPVVTTIHGDYLQFFNKTRQQIPIPLVNYDRKALSNLKQLKKIVCISDKQIEFFNNNFSEDTKGKIVKIYNGYDGYPEQARKTLRKRLNIQETDMVFGMVSRGIAEKGWEVAINAIQKLNNPHIHLVLIGESDYLVGLSEKYKSETQVHFIGHSDKPLDWITMMDVGLLPTTYASESLPTVIIEYLCCHIPSIASDAGEIINMLQINSKPAGIIVPIKNNSVSVDEVAAAMQRYITDAGLYATHKKNAILCYEQFDMNKCIESYLATYQDAIQLTKKQAQL